MYTQQVKQTIGEYLKNNHDNINEPDYCFTIRDFTKFQYNFNADIIRNTLFQLNMPETINVHNYSFKIDAIGESIQITQYKYTPELVGPLKIFYILTDIISNNKFECRSRYDYEINELNSTLKMLCLRTLKNKVI